MKINSINPNYNFIRDNKAIEDVVKIQKEMVETILDFKNKMIKINVQDKMTSQHVDTYA